MEQSNLCTPLGLKSLTNSCRIYTSWFVLEQGRNHENRFSCAKAHIIQAGRGGRGFAGQLYTHV